MRRQLEQPLAEQRTFWKSSLHKQLSKTCQTALRAIHADLESVERQIQDLIVEDNRLMELFDWITSIPGIGNATAPELLVATDEFNGINDAKKLAASAFRFEPLHDSKIRRIAYCHSQLVSTNPGRDTLRLRQGKTYGRIQDLAGLF